MIEPTRNQRYVGDDESGCPVIEVSPELAEKILSTTHDPEYAEKPIIHRRPYLYRGYERKNHLYQKVLKK